MKKLTALTFAAALSALALHGAGLTAVRLEEGDSAVPAPCRAVMLHAISTNASGTVALKRVAAVDVAWMERIETTNVVYGTAWSNLTHVVTNDVVTAWRTNYVGGAVTSNYLARAVNAAPPVYPYPNLLIVTNKVEATEVYTNIPYQVEAERTVVTRLVPRTASRYVTNDLCSVTLSGGFKTNALDCVFAPGDFIVGSGTAFKGGRVQLIVER